ncbi:transcriptional regulator, TetR family [Sphingomonas laterariae]|uniref:Transcriptional regulator, TetR family n=1 Tax=Edaphosphingomonas laterariae TaxID=861865 RepID=A0A239HKV3_9SPHN|nr:TetR/AcrR family transcriptional regulator [Sphingomonas laterariae]SNS81761.1 transcriptional regulator, TetR family [Sphingomonas laterariae]
MPPAQALSQREQNKRRIRGNILKAARAKFERAGIADTTMDEIAEAASVSRATLYNYFPSRTEIVAALVERMDNDFVALIGRYRDVPGSTADRILGAFTESARILEADAEVSRLLVGISWQSWGGAISVGRMAHLANAFAGLMADESGIRDDVRRDVDPHLLAEMLVSIYVGIIHKWYIADDYPLERSLAAAGRLIAETVTRR